MNNTFNPSKPSMNKKQQARQRAKIHWRTKMRLNNHLRTVCSTFQMPEEFSYYLLNRTTAMETLTDLLDLSQQISLYSLDTENDQRHNRPALIQIEFVNDEHPIVILVELFHLPQSHTEEFHRLILLFQSILSSKNTIQTWGRLTDELSQCTIYGLFNEQDIERPVNFNVQDRFKSWYNQTHPHILACLTRRSPDSTYAAFFCNDDAEEEEPIDSFTNDDYQRCLCIERPYKSKTCLWSLQLATACTTGQYLDKSNTISQWGLGLDRTLQYNNLLFTPTVKEQCLSLLPQKNFKERHRLNKLTYAINDCFAVTKLTQIIQQPNHAQCLQRNQLLFILTSLELRREQQQLLFPAKEHSRQQQKQKITS